MRILISLLIVFVLSGVAGAADMFIYPQKDQTKEQQQEDEFACYRWAKEQTGFDPKAPQKDSGGGPMARRKAKEAQQAERQKYDRAIAACMEARGYTVK